MTTTRLPDCPGCHQSCTGVYCKKLGCTRCVTLVASAMPKTIDLMAALKKALGVPTPTESTA